MPPELASAENPRPPDHPVEEVAESDRWIDDFIRRLKHAIRDGVREKR